MLMMLVSIAVNMRTHTWTHTHTRGEGGGDYTSEGGRGEWAPVGPPGFGVNPGVHEE